MPDNNITGGDWATVVDVVARGVVYVFTGVASFALLMVFGFAALVAIAGTGGFTSSPPPAHPAWIGLLVCLSLWCFLQWCLVRSQRYFLRLLDKKFEGSEH